MEKEKEKIKSVMKKIDKGIGVLVSEIEEEYYKISSAMPGYEETLFNEIFQTMFNDGEIYTPLCNGRYQVVE